MGEGPAWIHSRLRKAFSSAVVISPHVPVRALLIKVALDRLYPHPANASREVALCR